MRRISSKNVKAIGLALALSVTVGLFGAAAPSTSSAGSNVRRIVVSTTGPGLAPATPLNAVGNVGTGASGLTSAPIAPDATKSIIGPLVRAILKYGKVTVKALKAAVKKGYSTFLKIWNKIPSWVKKAVSWGYTAYEVFKELYNYYF